MHVQAVTHQAACYCYGRFRAPAPSVPQPWPWSAVSAGVIGRHVLHFASSVDFDEWHERGYDRWLGYHQSGSVEYTWYYHPFILLLRVIRQGSRMSSRGNAESVYPPGASRLTVIIHLMQCQCYQPRRRFPQPTRAREASNEVGRQIYMGIYRLAVRPMMVCCFYTDAPIRLRWLLGVRVAGSFRLRASPH